MFLPDVFGAPRICILAGRPFWVRPLDADGLATILAWLDDFVDGRADRKGPPLFGSEEAQKWLDSQSGQTLIAWLALRGSGIDYETAAKLWEIAEDHERSRLISVFFTRRRTRDFDDEDSKGDVSETWCSKGMASLALKYGLANLGKLTLDQLDWLTSGGEVDTDPQYSTENLTKIQADWRVRHEAWLAEQKHQNGEADHADS